MKKHIRLIPALAFGMAMLSMPTLASAQSVTVNVLSPATVVAKGAGVDVSLQISCSNLFSAQATGNVLLNERVGNKITVGQGTSNDLITCDGSFQTFEAVVTSNTKFAQGSAVAQVSATVCNTSGTCINNGAQQTKTIELKK